MKRIILIGHSFRSEPKGCVIDVTIIAITKAFVLFVSEMLPRVIRVNHCVSLGFADIFEAEIDVSRERQCESGVRRRLEAARRIVPIQSNDWNENRETN
ncbi:unnamed protein product [Sphenostylis stenocarpa]|uniref:Uncharacterized protein n=1 Tax=Sphenostylis stenocarpa TaxID=92480 RepID=A0AA86VU96_9FABA|nr:unnamed protein product [Sphenostylis stenocarpa]